jgi:hypothetical protein
VLSAFSQLFTPLAQASKLELSFVVKQSKVKC